MWYVLDKNNNPVKCDALIASVLLGNIDERTVAKDTIGGVDISTVFLCLDHNYGEGPPILFETMVFGGKHDGYQERYHTWEEAEEGHKCIVEMVKSAGV